MFPCTIGAGLEPFEPELEETMNRELAFPLCAFLAAPLIAVVTACDDGEHYSTFEVTSAAFGDGQTIPIRHTCDGEDISPPLAFDGVPDKTVSYALIMDEPEAAGGKFTHWLAWGIPGQSGFLGADLPKTESPGGGVTQGTNDAETVGYSGPCPDEEDTDEHRYVLRVFALDAVPTVEAGAGREALEGAIDGHIIGKGKLVGYYMRED